MLNPAPQLDIGVLKQRASNLRSEVAALTARRKELSTPALQGNKQAQTDIKAIDPERAAKLAELETVEAAIEQLKAESRKRDSTAGRRRAGFIKDRWRHEQNFLNGVTSDYQLRARNISRLVNSDRDPSAAKDLATWIEGDRGGEVPSIADIPRRRAAEIVGLDDAERQLRHHAKKHQDDPGDPDIAATYAEAKELVEALRLCVNDLLTTEVPMPAELKSALARVESRGR